MAIVDMLQGAFIALATLMTTKSQFEEDEDRSLTRTDDEDIVVIPLAELVDLTRPLQSSFLFNHNSDTGFDPPSGTGKHRQVVFGQTIDLYIWSVIQKEVMDWYSACDAWETVPAVCISDILWERTDENTSIPYALAHQLIP